MLGLTALAGVWNTSGSEFSLPGSDINYHNFLVSFTMMTIKAALASPQVVVEHNTI